MWVSAVKAAQKTPEMQLKVHPPEPEYCKFVMFFAVSVFAKVTWQVLKICSSWRSGEQSCICAAFEQVLPLLRLDPSSPESTDFSLFARWPVRCLSLVPHPRPSPSAPDCWNTHQWRGCLHWRRARTLSSTSCASPTPACPAAENCHSSSTSVPLVRLTPSRRCSDCRVGGGVCADIRSSLFFQSCLFSLSWTPHSFLLMLVRRHRLPHTVGIGTWTRLFCYCCAFPYECTNKCLCFSHHRGQCVRQFRPVQLSTWIYQQQRLSTHPSVIFFFFFF